MRRRDGGRRLTSYFSDGQAPASRGRLSEGLAGSALDRPQAVMADGPFRALAVSKESFRCEEEQAPAPSHRARPGAIGMLQDPIDLAALRVVEIAEPVAAAVRW